MVDFSDLGASICLHAQTWLSDKRLDVGSVISSTMPFKIVLQKGLTVDFERVSRSWLVW